MFILTPNSSFVGQKNVTAEDTSWLFSPGKEQEYVTRKAEGKIEALGKGENSAASFKTTKGARWS